MHVIYIYIYIYIERERALTERSFDVISLSIKLRNFGGIIRN